MQSTDSLIVFPMALQKKAHTFILQILISERGIFRKEKKMTEKKKPYDWHILIKPCCDVY